MVEYRFAACLDRGFGGIDLVDPAGTTGNVEFGGGSSPATKNLQLDDRFEFGVGSGRCGGFFGATL
jgi:hypothetical protein